MKNETAYWLALINKSGLSLSILKPIVQQWVLAEGKSIIDLFNQSVAELSFQFNLSEIQAQTLLKATETHQKHLQQLETWQTQGIEVLTLSHPHYPKRLIYSLPPKQQPLILWAKGKTALLTEPTITVLGNATPTPETVQFIEDLAAQLVEENIGVVSGYGKGLDRIAFEAMLNAPNSHAIAILPMGLTAFSKLTSKLNKPVETEQAVLLSPFPPPTAFSETLAAARNLLVDSLALALLVPVVDEISKPRAEGALERGMPVLVDMTDSEENRALIAAGAFLMTDPDEVIEMVQQAIIDNTMQAQIAQKPASTEPAPAPTILFDDEDDYALGKTVADPIDPNEALDIFSSMGNVPTSLRAKLMAIEKQNEEE